MENQIISVLKNRRDNSAIGIYSACTANRMVLEAVMERAMETGTYALIESTANQVNQFGGYTGMNPAGFAAFVHEISDKLRFPKERLILGGDHLGPLTWQNEPEDTAMQKARTLIADYVAAGFTKIHIDTSMRLANDDKNVRLPDETIARRAAELCRAAEEAALDIPPVYVTGSEVPVPGGAAEAEEVSVTTPQQFEDTYNAFKQAFEKSGLHDAFSRVAAVVVQPGVEFSDMSVTEYNRGKSAKLCAALKKYPGLVFEGHSTDYQTPAKLKEMVEDGIAILKVGPALTYALRQALFALSDIEREALSGKAAVLSDFKNVLDNTMLNNPVYWKKYYHGDEHEIALKRKYSFSDRCRYYLPDKEVDRAVSILIDNINKEAGGTASDGGSRIPLTVIDQYMPNVYKKLRRGEVNLTAEALIKAHIKDLIDDYIFAVTP